MKFFNGWTIFALVFAIYLSIHTSIDFSHANKYYKTAVVRRDQHIAAQHRLAVVRLERGRKLIKLKRAKEQKEEIRRRFGISREIGRTIKAFYPCTGDYMEDQFGCIPTARNIFPNQGLFNWNVFDIDHSAPLLEDHEIETDPIIEEVYSAPVSTTIPAIGSTSIYEHKDTPNIVIEPVVMESEESENASAERYLEELRYNNIGEGEEDGNEEENIVSIPVTRLAASKTSAYPPMAYNPTHPKAMIRIHTPIPIPTHSVIIGSKGQHAINEEKEDEDAKEVEMIKMDKLVKLKGKGKWTREEKVRFWKMFIPYVTYMSACVWVINL